MISSDFFSLTVPRLVWGIVLLFLILIPLSAGEEGSVIVFMPFEGNVVIEEPRVEKVQDAVLGALEFDLLREVIPLSSSLDPVQIGNLIDVTQGGGEPDALGFPDDRQKLLEEAALVIVPKINFFDVISEEDSTVLCRIGLLFNIIETGHRRVMETFTVESEAEEETGEEALNSTLASVRKEVEHHLKKLAFYRSESFIVEILDKKRIILSFSKETTVEPGDEFIIISRDKIGATAGIILIEDVVGQVSYGYIIYSETELELDEKLEQMDRFGLEVSVYGRPMVSLFEGPIPFTTVFGIRGYPSRRFPHVRPFLGLEVPVHGKLDGWPGLPVHVLAGLETRWNLGRLQVAPASSFGLSVLTPLGDGEEFLLSHLGGSMEVAFSWLVHPDLRFFLTAGYGTWTSIDWTALTITGEDDYGGIIIGAGVRLQL